MSEGLDFRREFGTLSSSRTATPRVAVLVQEFGDLQVSALRAFPPGAA
jgi:hypothetical protein